MQAPDYGRAYPSHLQSILHLKDVYIIYTLCYLRSSLLLIITSCIHVLITAIGKEEFGKYL